MIKKLGRRNVKFGNVKGGKVMSLLFGMNLKNWSLPFGLIFCPGILVELSFLCFYLEISWDK